MIMNKIDLKPCPFCGNENVYSELHTRLLLGGEKGYEIHIGCKECKYYLKAGYLSEGDFMSLKEMLEFMGQAAEKWNTRNCKF